MPLIEALAHGCPVVASDIPAFLSHSSRVVFLEDDEMAVLMPDHVTYFGADGDRLQPSARPGIGWAPVQTAPRPKA